MEPHDLHSKTLSLFVTVAGDDGVFGLSFSLLLASPLPQVAHFPISIHIHSFGRSAKECATQAGFHENSNSIYFWDRLFSIRKWCWTQFAHRPSIEKCTKEYSFKTITHLVNHLHRRGHTSMHAYTAESFQSGCLFVISLCHRSPYIEMCVCAYVHVSLTQSSYCTHA